MQYEKKIMNVRPGEGDSYVPSPVMKISGGLNTLKYTGLGWMIVRWVEENCEARKMGQIDVG